MKRPLPTTLLAVTWFLVCGLVLAAPATKATRTSGTLVPDTRFATTYYIQDTGLPGPTVLVTGGVHGDEPAGAAAADAIRGWTITRGRLIVIPKLNVPGLAAGRRRIPEVDAALADLNRDFPRAGKDEPPRGTPALEIWRFVRNEKPDWLIDLHEAGSFRQSQTGSVGNTVLICPSPAMSKVVPLLLKAVNGNIAEEKKHFVATRPPKDGSLARAAGTHLGIQAMIIETTRFGQPLALRVGQHQTIVRRLLEHLGMM